MRTRSFWLSLSEKSYDDIGNRVQQVVIPSGQPRVVTNYTYYQNSQSRNSQLLQSDGLSTYTWDNNGNLSAKAATQYTWDYDDRLVGISGPSTNASYAYDYLGRRIKKTISGAETAYLYLSEDIVKETTGGIVANYLPGIGIDDPVMMDRAGVKSYYFSDGLGSIRELTDAMGTVQNSYTYGAWGELRAQNVTGPNSYGYTGREFAEEGLYYYRGRYLAPSIGRFTSTDLLDSTRPIDLTGETDDYYVAFLSFGITGDDSLSLNALQYDKVFKYQLAAPLALNSYIYVRNNPIIYIDPDGLFPIIDQFIHCPKCRRLKKIWDKYLKECRKEYEEAEWCEEKIAEFYNRYQGGYPSLAQINCANQKFISIEPKGGELFINMIYHCSKCWLIHLPMGFPKM